MLYSNPVSEILVSYLGPILPIHSWDRNFLGTYPSCHFLSSQATQLQGFRGSCGSLLGEIDHKRVNQSIKIDVVFNCDRHFHSFLRIKSYKAVQPDSHLSMNHRTLPKISISHKDDGQMQRKETPSHLAIFLKAPARITLMAIK